MITGQRLLLLSAPLSALSLGILLWDPYHLVVASAVFALASIVASIFGTHRVALGLDLPPRDVALFLVLVVLTPLGPFAWAVLHLQANTALEEASVPTWWLGATVSIEAATRQVQRAGAGPEAGTCWSREHQALPNL